MVKIKPVSQVDSRATKLYMYYFDHPDEPAGKSFQCPTEALWLKENMSEHSFGGKV